MKNGTNLLAKVPSASPDEVNAYLDSLWRDLLADDEIRGNIQAEGIDLSAGQDHVTNPFKAERDQDGSTAGFAEAVLIGIMVDVGSDLTMKALNAIWDKFIKPRFENRYGKVEKLD